MFLIKIFLNYAKKYPNIVINGFTEIKDAKENVKDVINKSCMVSLCRDFSYHLKEYFFIGKVKYLAFEIDAKPTEANGK